MDRVATAGTRSLNKYVYGKQFDPPLLKQRARDLGPASSLTNRRPPLRTYSKRTSSNNNAEPLTKRQRIQTKKVDIHSIAGRFVQKAEAVLDQADTVQPQLPPVSGQQPKKGTILSYFKVRSPSSGTSSPPCAQSCEMPIPSSTPPSSPQSTKSDISSRKKSRRLTTKPAVRNNDPQKQLLDEVHGSDGEKVASEGAPEERYVLQPTDNSRLNTNRIQETNGSNTGKCATAKKQRTKQVAVQTTLSLSLTEKQFIECEECNMLYNPYHEKDVKMHKKRHAAIMKSKKVPNKSQH